jgi:hypothetical protein
MPSRRLKIAIKDHYSESMPFARALHAAGHQIVSLDSTEADVLFMDLDPPFSYYRDLIKNHSRNGAKIALYPHGGGGPILSYDALWEPYELVDVNFVTGVGHAEYLRRIEYPTPVHAVGWSFSEIRPFRPRAEVRNVLFAPMHPNGDGSMSRERRDLNGEVFSKLLEGPWRLTVRYIGTLEQNGLWETDGARFVNGKLLAQTQQIDTADAVVAASGTFPTLAMARGVPTVMYRQGDVALGLPDEKPSKLRRPERYWDYARYPIDYADGPLDELIHAAARSDDTIAAWRRRFVGEALDGRAFVERVERLVEGESPLRIDETRRFTTLALADELAERPQLLRDYVERVGAQDDASLLIWAPGLTGERLLSTTESAIEAAGLDADQLPDVLLAPSAGGPAATKALAARADAVLSDWPAVGPIGKLPRFSALPVGV